MKQKIIFVTGNKNKLREAREILDNLDVDNKDIDLEEIQDTPENIVKEKSKRAFETMGKKCFVEDVSLELEALNGLPGPFVKFFIKNIGAKGIHDMISFSENKKAKVVCVIGFHDGKKTKTLRAEVKGKIVSPRQKGNSPFGFDPIFQPEGHDKTYAEMTKKEKNSCSHRRKALEMLKAYLED